MTDNTTRLLEALKEVHPWQWTEHVKVCKTCQLIAEVEAELKGEKDE